MTASPPSPPLRGFEDLFGLFTRAFHPNAALVGIECERVALFDDGVPLHYEGDAAHPGVRAIFDALVLKHGWTAVRESEGAPVLSLTRGEAAITLEPGSQFELSGAPLHTVHEVVDELERTRAEFTALDEARGLYLLGLGFHPFARQEDLDWVPKSRYPIMRSYLPTRGRYGLDMMRRTATVQANFDFRDEHDAMRKLRAGLALSPVATALFANSPFVEGARTGGQSHRAEVWLDVDNDRAGLLPFAWRDGATIADYIEWALDVPMFIVKHGKEVKRATHLTFRRFMAEGLDGAAATEADWETHVNTLFPEARLKRTIEVRGADSVPLRYAAALPALWLPVFYDDDVLALVEARCVSLGHDVWAEARPRIAREALRAKVGDTTVGAIAREVLAACMASLARRDRRDAQGRDERAHLEGLVALAAEDRSVGEALFDGYDPAGPDAVAELIRRARF
jgi:glutamate--cysteine ligase